MPSLWTASYNIWLSSVSRHFSYQRWKHPPLSSAPSAVEKTLLPHPPYSTDLYLSSRTSHLPTPQGSRSYFNSAQWRLRPLIATHRVSCNWLTPLWSFIVELWVIDLYIKHSSRPVQVTDTTVIAHCRTPTQAHASLNNWHQRDRSLLNTRTGPCFTKKISSVSVIARHQDFPKDSYLGLAASKAHRPLRFFLDHFPSLLLYLKP